MKKGDEKNEKKDVAFFFFTPWRSFSSKPSVILNTSQFKRSNFVHTKSHGFAGVHFFSAEPLGRSDAFRLCSRSLAISRRCSARADSRYDLCFTECKRASVSLATISFFAPVESRPSCWSSIRICGTFIKQGSSLN